jgi:hypothetical protein
VIAGGVALARRGRLSYDCDSTFADNITVKQSAATKREVLAFILILPKKPAYVRDK